MNTAEYQKGSSSGALELKEAGSEEAEVERSMARTRERDFPDPYADAPEDRRELFTRNFEGYSNR